MFDARQRARPWQIKDTVNRGGARLVIDTCILLIGNHKGSYLPRHERPRIHSSRVPGGNI